MVEEKNVRLPPQNLEAEQALLAALLINNSAFDKVGGFLLPEHFFGSVNKLIYEAILKIKNAGQTYDAVLINSFLLGNPIYEEVGGFDYLTQLLGDKTSIVNAEDYAKLIYDRFLRREIITLGTDIVNESYQTGTNIKAGDIIGNAETKIFDLNQKGNLNKGAVAFKKAGDQALEKVQEAMKNKGEISGLSTGFADLNKLTAGLHNTDLIIIGGRPGMGKTAFVTCLAYNVAEDLKKRAEEQGEKPRGVAFFSLEMSADQLASRILSAQAKVSLSSMRNGKLSTDDFVKLSECNQALENLPLFVNDHANMDINEIQTQCRKMKHDPKMGLGLVIIDYLGLIDLSSVGYAGQKTQQIGEVSRRLKIMAKELDVPVVVLSQLNRGTDGSDRDSKRPQLSDLRDSGAIEQDADLVMFVYREYYYKKNAKPDREKNESEDKYQQRLAELEVEKQKCKNLAEVIVAKNRHGGVDTIKFTFLQEYTKFSDFVDDAEIESYGDKLQ